VQVQQRQHLVDLWGLAAPRRQDHRGEPLPFAGGLVDALVVDPRCAHLDRTRGGHYLPGVGVPVAHDQAPAALVELVDMRRDVGGDLGLQRRGEHPPRTVADDLVDQRPAGNQGCWHRLVLGD
jgi:hypothetical protein